MEFPKKIRGSFVKNWRKENGLSQEKAAALIGLEMHTWAKIEKSVRLMSWQEAELFRLKVRDKELVQHLQAAILHFSQIGSELAEENEKRELFKKILDLCKIKDEKNQTK